MSEGHVEVNLLCSAVACIADAVIMKANLRNDYPLLTQLFDRLRKKQGPEVQVALVEVNFEFVIVNLFATLVHQAVDRCGITGFDVAVDDRLDVDQDDIERAASQVGDQVAVTLTDNAIGLGHPLSGSFCVIQPAADRPVAVFLDARNIVGCPSQK